MKMILEFFLRFAGKKYSALQKTISMAPGFLVFLVLSPAVIYRIAIFGRGFITLTVPRSVELTSAAIALLVAISLMSWALFELWTKGEGTPAPITPTCRLVTTGPYRWGRNPIELGTNIYFFALGAFFDSLVTGIFCMFFGLLLGSAYIKLIEEKEMLMRFGKPYNDYLHHVPFMAFPGLRLFHSEENSSDRCC